MMSPAAKKRALKKQGQREATQPVDEHRESKPGMPACPPGVPSKVCEYCGRSGHWKEVCPKFAADHRWNKQGVKESEAALADFKSTGNTCSLCGWNDYYDYHHRDAACDATYVVDPANPNRSLFGKKAEAVKAKASGKGNGQDGQTGATRDCPDGVTCKWLHPRYNQGSKFYFHPTGH